MHKISQLIILKYIKYNMYNIKIDEIEMHIRYNVHCTIKYFLNNANS